MSLSPIVRYLIPCRDVEVDASHSRSLNILGLLTTIRVADDDDGPFYFAEMCVLTILTAIRRQGRVRVSCSHDESGSVVFATQWRELQAAQDPLQVVPVLFRVREFSLPHRGYFSIRVEYNELVLAESPVVVK